MIKIRNNVFETNSSSMHSLCISKNSEYFTKKEILESCTLSEGFIVFHEEDELNFDRYPFQILTSFYDKLRYVIPSLCDQNSEDADKKLLETAFNKIAKTITDVLPEVRGIILPRSYYDEEEVSYGWIDHQSAGILKNYLDEKKIDLKEFLTNKKYWVIIDGDEYHEWERLKSCGIINTSLIDSEYSESDEDREWLEYLKEHSEECAM